LGAASSAGGATSTASSERQLNQPDFSGASTTSSARLNGQKSNQLLQRTAENLTPRLPRNTILILFSFSHHEPAYPLSVAQAFDAGMRQQYEDRQVIKHGMAMAQTAWRYAIRLD